MEIVNKLSEIKLKKTEHFEPNKNTNPSLHVQYVQYTIYGFGRYFRASDMGYILYMYTIEVCKKYESYC